MNQQTNRNIARKLIKNFKTNLVFDIAKGTNDLLDSPYGFGKPEENNQHEELWKALNEAKAAIFKLEEVFDKLCQDD